MRWGYIAIYLRGQLKPRRAGRFPLRSQLPGNEDPVVERRLDLVRIDAC